MSQSTNCGDRTRPRATWAATTAAQSRTTRAGSASLRHAATHTATTTATARRPASEPTTEPSAPVTSALRTSPVPPSATPVPSAPRPSSSAMRPSAEHEAAREALDLKPARELRADREPRLAGREREEGEDDDRGRHRGDADDDGSGPPARPSERDDREQRQQEEGIQLRGDREPQHERGEPGPAGEERCDRARRQGDGQRIEARQHELAEQERRGGDETERDGRMTDRRAQRVQ